MIHQRRFDITQRKLAEQSLHASEERFRKVFEEGPLGWHCHLDSRIQHVNRRFCEMLATRKRRSSHSASPASRTPRIAI